jgi:hypothetical protein
VLDDALRRQALLGTTEFYVSPGEMLRVLKRALSELPRPVLSLNRPHAGGKSIVHRVEWRGLVFTSVSHRPLAVG